MTSTSVQHLLEAAYATNSSAKIIAYQFGTRRSPTIMSYRELLTIAKYNSRNLQKHATWRHGSVIMIHLKDQLSTIIWFWSVLFAGNIPAISTALPNNNSQKTIHLRHMNDLLEQPIWLTSRDEVPQFSEHDFLRITTIETINQYVNTVSDNDGRDLPLSHFAYGPALLMLTSGSTSNAKAVSLDHQQLWAAVRGKSTVVQLPKSTGFLNWIAMDHAASLVEIHLQALYLGMDQVHVPSSDVVTNPTYFLDLIDRHRISRTFAPNFFLAKLQSTLDQYTDTSHWDLSCLRYIASGGEANVTANCVAVTKLFQRYQAPPNVVIPGFGMTETCAGAIFNVNCPTYDVENELESPCLGACMPGIEMRITKDDQVLPAGVTGDLEVRGPVVFNQYYNNPAATAAALVDGEWFCTGDRAMIDHSGYLRLTGRAKDVIIVNGVKYSPHDVESAIEEAMIPGITPGSTVAFSSWSSSPRLATEKVHVLYLPAYQRDDEATQLATSKAIVKQVVLVTGSRPNVIPVDDNILQKSSLGKVSRSKLKSAFEKGELRLFEESNQRVVQSANINLHKAPTNKYEAQILEVFLSTLHIPHEDFDVETPFFDAGITSIELIQLKRNIKQALKLESEIPITTLINHPTVRTLAESLIEPKEQTKYNPVVTLQSEGNKTPLWLIHPGVGEVLVFVALSKFITNRKLYALRARGFNENEEYFTSIKEAVDTYHESVKQRQPQGPYAIAGYSYGTMLAFELAKKLESTGDKVAFCGSFNLPPHIKTRMRQLNWNECLLHLSYFLRLFDEQHGRQLAEEFSHSSHSSQRQLHEDSHKEILATVLRDADRERMENLSLTPTGLANWASLAYSLQSMASDYDPSGSVECIDVFYCTPLAVVSASKDEWVQDHLSKWGDFVRSRPRFHEVQGEHYTMLDPENVFTFQQVLNKALRARGI